MSQTTRSSFSPLPLINKAITDSQRHNYVVITQNNRFPLSTFHACFTRVPPQITPAPTPSLPPSPVLLLPHTHTHTLPKRAHMYLLNTRHRHGNTHGFMRKVIHASVGSRTHTHPHPSLPELVLFSSQVVSWQHTRQSPPMQPLH